jgi:hypothetical protein
MLGYSARDLALEPIGSCDAIENQAGEDANDEDDQKADHRAQAHVRVLLIVLGEDCSRVCCASPGLGEICLGAI